LASRSFWIGGFECSCHRHRDGRRLDLIAATGHDRLAIEDYARLRRAGIGRARDGVRWHLVERSPGQYDFSSLLPLVSAARDAGVEVIWDLCHYGWPEDVDLFRPQFVDRFAAYARAVARCLIEETDAPLWLVPVNEISFWSWAGGETAHVDPYGRRRGFELKTQLVRACLAAVDEIWSVAPDARILHPDPAIHILPKSDKPGARAKAEGYRQAQFQAWDMIAGKLWPQLGGEERFLDVVGIDYYPYNQWIYRGPAIPVDSPLYRPFREILAEIYARYGRPILIAETGAQEDARAPWLTYVGEEVRAALRQGIPIQGICLYPILDYPGWKDDRHCATGLWSFPDAHGERPLYHPLARELERQRDLFERELPRTSTDDTTDRIPAAVPGEVESEHHAAACSVFR